MAVCVDVKEQTESDAINRQRRSAITQKRQGESSNGHDTDGHADVDENVKGQDRSEGENKGRVPRQKEKA